MTIPTLTPRAAREQSTFRALLASMSHPAAVSRLDFEGANPLVVIAEALVDHEVTFAVAPERPDLTEAILRQTGSHVAPLDVAQYVFCETNSLELVLNDAADGTWEYPDAGATVICLVEAVHQEELDEGRAGSPSPERRSGFEGPPERLSKSERGLGGEVLRASGPGIRDAVSIYIEGFSPGVRRAFTERNAARPLGLDLVLVTMAGDLVSFTRYTNLEEE